MGENSLILKTEKMILNFRRLFDFLTPMKNG